jgi:cell wall-associated NlpC family hydrolase
LDHLTTTQQATLRQYRTRQLRLAQAEQAVQEEEAKVRAVNAEIASHEADVSARLADAQRVLGRLSAAERARLARMEAQRRARQEAEARRERQTVRLPSGVVSSRARAAIKYALSQVGRPYSFSARPPSSWDCSKLTSAAWRQGGVGLTALSYTQWRQTRRIPTSQMRPGDLVFYFGRGAHHVALYIGNGKMVSASNPSDGVEIIDYLAPWYRERFSGVGRVIG